MESSDGGGIGSSSNSSTDEGRRNAGSWSILDVYERRRRNYRREIISLTITAAMDLVICAMLSGYAIHKAVTGQRYAYLAVLVIAAVSVGTSAFLLKARKTLFHADCIPFLVWKPIQLLIVLGYLLARWINYTALLQELNRLSNQYKKSTTKKVSESFELEISLSNGDNLTMICETVAASAYLLLFLYLLYVVGTCYRQFESEIARIRKRADAAARVQYTIDIPSIT